MVKKSINKKGSEVKKLRLSILSLIMFTATIILNTGCTGVEYKPKSFVAEIYHDSTKKSGLQVTRFPMLDNTNTVEVGDNMYQKKYEEVTDTYKVVLLEPVIGISTHGAPHYEGFGVADWASLDSTKMTSNEKENLYLLKTRSGDKNATGLGILYIIDANNTGYFTHITTSYADEWDKLSNPAKYQLIPIPPAIREGSFKYEALYQGKIDNKIKISFREFKDDMARPAFTQDIDYLLEKDGTAIVGFKGLRIEVLKATNVDITYKVVKDYN
ncbi:MAG: hypothetical protein WCW84_01695 [Sulfurimonas sp.]|jgi:hypothetical protein